MNETHTIALEASYQDGISSGFAKTAESVAGSSRKAREGLDELKRGFKETEDAVRKAQAESRTFAQVQQEAILLRIRATKTGFDQERALAQVEHARRLAEFQGNNKLLWAEQQRHQAALTLIAKREADDRVRIAAAEAEKEKAAAERARAGTFGGQLGAKVATVTMAAAGFFALSQAQQFLSTSLSSARESIAVQTELASTLRSTGYAAGVTQDQLNEQAEALQRVTRFSDEAIGKSQAMLLTFTRIGKDVLPEATESTLDLAQKFGGDATQAAIMLGKALNDPIAGLTNLARVGVQFSNAQETQIKQFMRQGNLLAAQKVILAEIQVQTGGLARSMGDQDPFTRFHNTMDGIKEMLGAGVLPVLADTAEAAIKFVNSFRDADGLGDFFERLSANAGKDFSKSLPDADKLRDALITYRDLDRQMKSASTNMVNMNMGGPFMVMGDQIQKAKREIEKLAGDEKAKAFFKDINTAISDLSETVDVLEEKQKAAANRKPAVDVDPAVLKERQAAEKRRKEMLLEMGAFEADQDFKKQKRAIEEEKRKEKETRTNQALEEEYQKGKQEFENQLSALGTSRLEQELQSNKKHFDALRKEATEWFLDEAELKRAQTQIDRAEAQARLTIWTQLAQGQLATVTQNLQTMASRWKVFGTAYKVAAHAQNLIDTYAGATASYKSLAGIPYVGPVLGAAAAALAIGAGMARGAVIQAQKFTTGGLVEGQYTSGDRIPVWANAGEMFLNKTQQSRLFSMLNGGTFGGGMTQRNSWQVTFSPQYNFNGANPQQDFMRVLRSQPAAFGEWFMRDVVGRGYARMAA